MADNYLERKMEEHRGGSKAPRPLRRTTSFEGKAVFDFPRRRVLVVGGASAGGEAIVDRFLQTGSKVAVFDPDSDKGHAMAHDKGVRFYAVSEISDTTKAFADLLHNWLDTDIVVIADSMSAPAEALARQWAAHKDRFKIPAPYLGRLICISPQPCGADKALERSDIIVKTIDPSGRTTREIADICLLMALPLSDII